MWQLRFEPVKLVSRFGQNRLNYVGAVSKMVIFVLISFRKKNDISRHCHPRIEGTSAATLYIYAEFKGF